MTQSTARKKILIVEDDAAVLEILSLTLRKAGYEVLKAEHALAAIFAMVRSGADLVLTDIRMPIMDGLGLVRELKTHADSRHIPIIAMTGMDTPESRAAALKAGCAGYITKPIDVPGLLNQIAAILHAKQ